MATTRRWLAIAAAVAQVENITPTGPVVAGETWSVTINAKTVSFTATAGTVANVTAGLAAALSASTIAEFAEITWTDGSTKVIGTGKTAGVPFTVTVSTDSAGGSLATATGTAATGPNHWNNANNWSTGTVPVSTDTALVDLAFGSILYGLDQSAVTLASLVVFSTSANGHTLGLPRTNATGGYTEYREQELKIGATACQIDTDASRVRLNFGAVQTALEVTRSGQSQETGVPAVLINGTHAGNTVEVKDGNAGIGFYPGDAPVVATLRVAAGGTVVVGSGATLGTVNSLGTLDIQCASTALNITGGTARVRGSGACGTLEVAGTNSRVSYESSGTVTTANIGPGVVDCSADLSARTFSATTLRAGGQIIDPRRTITHTAGVAWGSTASSFSAA